MATKPAERRSELLDADLSYAIVAAFFRTYKGLKYGLLESLYGRAMEKVLKEYGLRVDRELSVPVYFEGEQIGFHRFDLMVEGKIIVEIKSTEVLPSTAKRQLRGYRAATGLRLGILLHFGPKANYYRVIGPTQPEQALLASS
jgi:GxxExxY protein